MIDIRFLEYPELLQLGFLFRQIAYQKLVAKVGGSLCGGFAFPHYYLKYIRSLAQSAPVMVIYL